MRFPVILPSIFMVLGCAVQPPDPTLDQVAYDTANTNARAVSPALVYDNLFPINDANPHLVWKGPADGRMLKIVSLMSQVSAR